MDAPTHVRPSHVSTTPDDHPQGHEIYERGPNHYQLLQVGRSSTPLEIKKAYKKQSLELHPDKGGTAEDFARIKDAYDVRACVRAGGWLVGSCVRWVGYWGAGSRWICSIVSIPFP